jgi:hypothetical protein
MKVWVEARTIEPPEFTVSGRFGSSVMFVAYWRVLDQWVWLQPGGIEEKIAEPQMIFVEQDYANKHALKTPRGRREKPTHIRRGKCNEQLSLDL